ncbi:MAG TPA: glycosyltransferase [Longimicrobiales bacterium]|nr:glycosyltransferase [Longimicrobiales bacterium]
MPETPLRVPPRAPLGAERVAVILSTYEWPHALELTLAGYARQTMPGFQLVIADDGSGADTRALIERCARETGIDVVHVWHEDRGFRKSEILNRAILATQRDYVVFSDGDTIPREDLVEVHVREAAPDRFLAGGYVKLPRITSEAITLNDVRSGRVFDLRWLRSHGYRPGRYALRFTRSRAWGRLLDFATSHKVRWVGNNASTWRTHLIEANGFDMEMGYGGQDAALGDRLENLGIRPRRIRYRTLALHLHHERPWRDPAGVRRNIEIRQRIRASGEVRATRGIDELP